MDPLPPLEWLRVFEAAGRRGSFTAAAEELNLTQASVSQRIRNLEARIGVRLFLRLPRGVELTADGEAYLPHVRMALDALRRGTSDLFGVPRRKVTLAAPASVASLWIAPRLPALTAGRPDLQVSIATVHRPADFAAADADFEVRFGDGDWPERRAVRLFDEVLVPVAAPAALAEARGDWRELPLIAVSGPRDGWLQWATATGAALPRPSAIRFDSLAPALEAARAGTGALLTSLPLSRAALESGALVRLDEPPLEMSGGYWLTWPAAGRSYARDDTLISALSGGLADEAARR